MEPADTLRILVVSTPKTGNTWLKCLLSKAYNLPVIDVPSPEFWRDFDPVVYEALGPRWIAHQHFPPFEPFVRWAQEQGIVFVTTVRHPADTLVSVHHYVQNFAGKTQIDSETVRLLRRPRADEDERPQVPWSKELETFVRDKFFRSVNFSIAWLQRGLSYGVRYEDLWRSPDQILRALTNDICPISDEAIEEAVQRCRLETMRAAAGEKGLFFRGGGVAGWKTNLPERIIAMLGRMAPYPAQMEWLGYETSFAGPVPPDVELSRVPPALSELSFFPLDFALGDVAGDRTSEASYYAWFNAVAERDPHHGRIAPVITNLGGYLHRRRSDLRAIFSDLYGQDRVAFSHWFTQAECIAAKAMDACFVLPVYQSWVDGPQPLFSPVHYPVARRHESLVAL
ncbi:MAG: hypothetical protein DLM52_04390 [Chthoniobacterales bacterium]|nr:MAG: hypothetical protein DLM52_04390 [Chthoniobacterales bacterium]